MPINSILLDGSVNSGTSATAEQIAAAVVAKIGRGYTIYLDSSDTQNAALSLRQRDVGVAIRETLRYPDGTPMDLSGKTVRFLLKKQGANVAKVNQPAAILWAAGGVAEYIARGNDLDTVGSFYRVWTVTDSAGNTVSYPAGENLGVRVTAQLA